MTNVQVMPEEKDGFVATLNKTGFMTTSLDPYTQAFIEFSSHAHKPVLDIGAAFGIASIAALQKGATVIANDIDQRHLDILKERTPTEFQSRLSLQCGKFPDGLSFESESLGAILACRIMHFLDGDTMERGAKSMFSWLTSGGKAFVVGETVYVGTMKNFVKEYEKRVQNGIKYPGYFDDVHERCALEVRDKLPPTKHFFDPVMLTRVFQDVGFVVEDCKTFARPDFPQWLQLDGRESVGLIATKP